MSIWGLLYSLIIGPLQLLFEIIFSQVNKVTSNPGLTVIIESLLLNILLYPLYSQADRIQEAATAKEKAMKPMVEHIRHHFKGDERVMMLQAYYRENSYSPLSIISTSLPVLLQIPFFLAAYNMLSNNIRLVGASFGPIANLCLQDGLVRIGGHGFNLLPVLMTLINIISGFIYAKRQPRSARIQLYLMAAVFFAVLYKSPSGLVLYWTFNNLFALIKNVYFKLVPPSKRKSVSTVSETGTDRLVFIFSCLSVALLTGFLIPGMSLSVASQDFINMFLISNPVLYLIKPLLTAIGLFVLWPLVFYFEMGGRARKTAGYVMLVMAIVAPVNAFTFSNGFGQTDKYLRFNNDPKFSSLSIAVNILAILLVVMLVYLFRRRYSTYGVVITVALSVLYAGAGIYMSTKINNSYRTFVNNSIREEPQFTLSKEGRNVVVIMLDRAVGPMVPYIFNEDKDLVTKFDGFTYYSNVLSYGPCTNYCTPSLFGGYDYTPEKLNERDDRLLPDKHNEALKVLPTIFTDNGYSCAFINPSYAGYQWIPDLSVFNDCKGVTASNTFNQYENADYGTIYNNMLEHNIMCYGLFKVSPVAIQPLIYSNGTYNILSYADAKSGWQSFTGTSVAVGHNQLFEAAYSALTSLADMTVIDDGSSNNILLYTCDSTHDVALLQEPEYLPEDRVDNTEYDNANTGRFTVNGRTMNMQTAEDYAQYESNMASYRALGDWFDYLRANNLYDNTRIIIVSDHGHASGEFDELSEDDLEVETDAEAFAPVLMVKDFNSTGFTTSDEFMTNADTPYLATEGLISNPVNPFTGNEITEDGKTGPQFVADNVDIDIHTNNGNTFVNSDWYTVQSDIWNKDNWKYAGNW